MFLSYPIFELSNRLKFYLESNKVSKCQKHCLVFSCLCFWAWFLRNTFLSFQIIRDTARHCVTFTDVYLPQALIAPPVLTFSTPFADSVRSSVLHAKTEKRRKQNQLPHEFQHECSKVLIPFLVLLFGYSPTRKIAVPPRS